MHQQEYKVVTLNVNGSHNPIKRGKIIAKMKQKKGSGNLWAENPPISNRI